MKNNRKLLMVMLTVVFIILAACGNTSDGANAKPNNQSSNKGSTEYANADTSDKDSTIIDNNTTENFSEGAENTQLNDQEGNSNTSTDSNDKESPKSSNNDSEITESKKDEYLKKLNEMEEADRDEEAGTTMAELEEQETDRYKKWDEELNVIYGVLKEQLSREQMDKLRDEQRHWIKSRDEVAKEASLKYKGGSTESLEYVATRASLTRERCYELVAHYIK
ncbi:lysozyme inhibitor LprI family protein [Lederbergia panacisoli]|uniref:lysozyme inhibitor LprI family protein n=1 Tax=Lederbergia panacisoli TaxID=1255251 RepID=UPI00214C164C|nr:lysozyme inhibitor LprI family protein [Lederbergia panacisoli]MCR2823308.1 DUF1311 domain-containing protein [Lederbergia panacisoli]